MPSVKRKKNIVSPCHQITLKKAWACTPSPVGGGGVTMVPVPESCTVQIVNEHTLSPQSDGSRQG